MSPHALCDILLFVKTVPGWILGLFFLLVAFVLECIASLYLHKNSHWITDGSNLLYLYL